MFSHCMTHRPFPLEKFRGTPGRCSLGRIRWILRCVAMAGTARRRRRGRDPIVIASEIVVALQTIVSREMDPQLPTVVTVGSFHAGTKHNIIPDEAHLQLSVRTMNPQQREKVLAAIARIANGIAAAAGVRCGAGANRGSGKKIMYPPR